jgi:hypothetical protein
VHCVASNGKGQMHIVGLRVGKSFAFQHQFLVTNPNPSGHSHGLLTCRVVEIEKCHI